MRTILPKHWKNRIGLLKSRLDMLLIAPRLLFTACPPIQSTSLLISFPRSGSSWIGSILGQTENALYLREPATTQHMLTSKHAISVFDSKNEKKKYQYQEIVKGVLKVDIPFAKSIVKYPEQWKSNTLPKHLFIKEINPLAINLFDSVNNIVYLVRHPFSVAKSYQALTWQTKDHFIKRFTTEELALIDNLDNQIREAGFWQQIGFLQGWIEARTKRLMGNSNYICVRYEDICASPETEMTKLMSFCRLQATDKTKKQLSESLTLEKEIGAGDFSLKRNRKQIGKVKLLTTEQDNYDTLIANYHRGFEAYCQHHNIVLSNSYQDALAFVSNED